MVVLMEAWEEGNIHKSFRVSVMASMHCCRERRESEEECFKGRSVVVRGEKDGCEEDIRWQVKLKESRKRGSVWEVGT